jgi:hypothetical protein
LTSEEKDAGLQRHKHLVLATLNYMLEYYTRSIVFEGLDVAKDYYEQQKLQVENYFLAGRLDKLQQQLHRLMEGLRSRVDLEFTGYIKEKTGYDIDLLKTGANVLPSFWPKKKSGIKKNRMKWVGCLDIIGKQLIKRRSMV